MRQWGSMVWQRAWPRVDVREVMNVCAPLAGDHDTLLIACVTWSTVRSTGQHGPVEEDDKCGLGLEHKTTICIKIRIPIFVPQRGNLHLLQQKRAKDSLILTKKSVFITNISVFVLVFHAEEPWRCSWGCRWRYTSLACYYIVVFKSCLCFIIKWFNQLLTTHLFPKIQSSWVNPSLRGWLLWRWLQS